MKQLLIVFFCIISAKLSHQVSTPESATYVAGVVEFSLDNIKNPVELLTAHTKRFVEIIKRDDTKNVDVLVFPEAVLNGVNTAIPVPDPKAKTVPCENQAYNGPLNDISCAAKVSGKYVVINIYMQTDCTAEQTANPNDTTPCTVPGKKLNIYNTNVVFDRAGAVIATYRKFNLYDEDGARAPFRHDEVTFQTDFGVTFGLFTCFDILFRYPALELVGKEVKNFIYPSMWFSELPFLTALQLQQNWAYTHNVNLLAAGANRPAMGTTGSGIYSGTAGALTSYMSEVNRTVVLTAEIPKKPGFQVSQTSAPPTRDIPRADSDYGLNIWEQDLGQFKINVLDFVKNATQHGEVCHNEQCCKYEVEVTDAGEGKDATRSYSYAVIAFKGRRTFAGAKNFNAGITACGLIACLSTDTSTCGKRFLGNTPTIRERYLVNKAKFVTIYNNDIPTAYTVAPSTLSTAIVPLSPTQFTYAQSQYSLNNVNYKEITVELTSPRWDLLTFGVFGRDFRMDAKGSASKTFTGFILVTLSVIISFLF